MPLHLLLAELEHVNHLESLFAPMDLLQTHAFPAVLPEMIVTVIILMMTVMVSLTIIML